MTNSFNPITLTSFLTPMRYCLITKIFFSAEITNFNSHFQSFDSLQGDKNIIKFDGDHNSSRPHFYYDSVSIFFYNVLHPPQISTTQSSKLEKYYDLGDLKTAAGMNEVIFQSNAVFNCFMLVLQMQAFSISSLCLLLIFALSAAPCQFCQFFTSCLKNQLILHLVQVQHYYQQFSEQLFRALAKEKRATIWALHYTPTMPPR